MNQTWESGKKTIGPNLVPKSFFGGFYLYQILNIVASYHCMQFQGKLMKQTWENDWKPSFGPDFGPNFVPKCFSKFYLYYMLWIVVSYHPMQFHGKLMNQTWENGKKTSFKTDFGPFGPNSGHQFFVQKCGSVSN